MDTGEILNKAKKDNVKFVKLMFTDFFGAIKAVTITVEKLREALEEGVWFDGSSIEGFARIAESDMFLKPDIGSYAVLPWRPKEKAVARFICDVYEPNGNPFEGDPRYILKKVTQEAKKMGFIYNVGPEIEFFLFNKNSENKMKPVPHDVGSYFDYSPRDSATDVRRDIVFALEKLGIDVETSHHEVAPGQHEIDFKYDEALKAADNAVTFKLAVKSIAQAHNVYASFMPKPIFGINGSGMHVHQSFFDLNDNNVFYDADDKYKLSKTAKSFIAGQLEHSPAMSGIVAPTVNSYKRLTPGYEAPVYICWAQINRSALIRIPMYSKGREQSTRAELRCPDPSCNPYLAFAVMLKAGLDGIKRNLELAAPVEEDVYEFDEFKLSKMGIKTLPESLGHAIYEMKNNKIVEETLGSQTFQRYIAAKKAEWDNYRVQVSQWEIEKYFEGI